MMAPRLPRDLAVVAVYLLGGAVVGVAVAWVLSASGRGVRPWLVAVLVMAAAGVLGACVALFRAQVPPPLPRPDPLDTPGALGGHRYLQDLASLEHSIGTALTEPGQFERTLRPALIDLVAVTLWSRLGIDLWSEPEKAQPILGASLWRMTMRATPDPTPPTAAQLAGWVQRLREIVAASPR